MTRAAGLIVNCTAEAHPRKVTFTVSLSKRTILRIWSVRALEAAGVYLIQLGTNAIVCIIDHPERTELPRPALQRRARPDRQCRISYACTSIQMDKVRGDDESRQSPGFIAIDASTSLRPHLAIQQFICREVSFQRGIAYFSWRLMMRSAKMPRLGRGGRTETSQR